MAEVKQFLDVEGLKLVKNDYTGKIDKKVDKETGKELYPTADKTKLEGIAEGAQVNVIESISINNTNATIQDKKATVTLDVLTSDSLDGYDTTENLKNTFVQKENGKGLSTNDFDADAKAITDKADATYATKTELGAKLDSTTAESTFAKKTDVASAVRWKGAVATQAQLPNSGQELGDMYDVQDTGMNYVWNGTGWDAFAPNIDISGKADTTDLPQAIPTETIQSILNETV